jgi:hypothetical protein
LRPPVVAFLASADWVGTDSPNEARRLCDLLGLTSPDIDWGFELPSHGFRTRMFSAGAKLSAVPTKLQFLDLTQDDPSAEEVGLCSQPPIRAIVDLHGARNQRTHATNVVVEDFDAALAWLAKRDVPVLVENPCEHIPYRRGWVGFSQQGVHSAGFDAGTYLEFIPLEAYPSSIVSSVAEPRPVPAEAPGLGRRTFLVTDLDAAIGQLASTFGLTPDAPIEEDDFLGVRRVVYSFGHQGGASLALAEPRTHGPAGDYLRAWGPGVFTTELRFCDAKQVLEHASSRGGQVLASDEASARALLTDRQLPGTVLEISPKD